MGKLEILRTQTANHYTTTAIASTVVAAEYRWAGKTETVRAEAGCALVLAADGAQRDLMPGAAYEVERFQLKSVRVHRVGGPSAAPWSGAKEEEKATYWFRQALLVDSGALVPEGSVEALLCGGSVDEQAARGVTLRSLGGHFNGILLDNGSRYEISGCDILARGDGGDDLSGWGAAIMADNRSVAEVLGCYIETEGAIRCALYVDNGSVAEVKDTVIYSKETADSYDEYAALTPAMMKRVPFALGMEGTVRSLNVMADGQGRFDNCIIVSTGWGAISTDSGTAYDVCGTYALDVQDTLSGIGTLERAVPGKTYTARKTVGGVEWGFTVGGSGYVTYADSGVHNRYSNVEFYSPDYIQVMGSGPSGSSYDHAYLYSGHTAFMTQQTGGGVFTLVETTVDVVDALMQIKSGAANTGYSHLVCDDVEVRFTGDSTRTDRGILVELVESDDAGNPGVTTYTVCDCPEAAKPTSSTVPPSSATLKHGTYEGDIYNSIYNYRQTLCVTLDNAYLRGTVSASRAIHVDLEGKPVPNGTVLSAFMGSREYDHANYAAAQGGFSGDCKLIGRFRHTPAPVVNNPIDMTIGENSTWDVTGEGWLGALTVPALEALQSDAPVTVHVKSLTVCGEALADGVYTAGNVTVEVDSAEPEIEDSGVADAGQTYGNVRYTFLSLREDGSPDSGAFTVGRQNYVDGNLYFRLIPAEGRRVTAVTAAGGTLEKNTAGGELAAYEQMLTPAPGAKEMTVTVTTTGA